MIDKSQWRRMKLGDVFCKPISGEWGEDVTDGIGTKVLRTTNFTNEGEIDFSSVCSRAIAADKVEQKKLMVGDTIIEKSGGSPTQPVGRVVFFTVDGEYLVNNFTSILRVDNAKHANSNFVFQKLFANHKFGYTKRYQRKTTGIINLSLSEYLEKEYIHLPPLPTQRLIAANLERVRSAIAKRREQLAKCDEYLRSLFYEMFGDPALNEKGWEISLLKNAGVLARGISKHRPRNATELLGGNHPLIQTGDIANAGLYITCFNSTYSEAGLAQSKMWLKGTLCITIAANIGKSAILSFNACFPDSVVGFLPTGGNNVIYVKYWLDSIQKTLEESAPQSAQKNINLNILSNLSIPIPPLALQRQFAARVERVERHKELIRKALARTEELYACLMQEYFA